MVVVVEDKALRNEVVEEEKRRSGREEPRL
jgi:hypothetical protein